MLRTLLILACILGTQLCAAPKASAQENPDTSIALPTEWSTYYVVLFRDGPTDVQPEDSARAVTNRHIQYQLRLQQSDQSLVAGGFGQGEDGLLGMTVLRAGSLEEAKQVAESDPAVMAGSLTVEVIEWYVPAGQLPE